MRSAVTRDGVLSSIRQATTLVAYSGRSRHVSSTNEGDTKLQWCEHQAEPSKQVALTIQIGSSIAATTAIPSYDHALSRVTASNILPYIHDALPRSLCRTNPARKTLELGKDGALPRATSCCGGPLVGSCISSPLLPAS